MKILEYEIIDISEGIDVNKTNLSKQCDISTAGKKRAPDSINRTISSYDEQIQDLKKKP